MRRSLFGFYQIDSLSKCKVGVLNVKYQGANGVKMKENLWQAQDCFKVKLSTILSALHEGVWEVV